MITGVICWAQKFLGSLDGMEAGGEKAMEYNVYENLDLGTTEKKERKDHYFRRVLSGGLFFFHLFGY